jgi:hypothetical protein
MFPLRMVSVALAPKRACRGHLRPAPCLHLAPHLRALRPASPPCVPYAPPPRPTFRLHAPALCSTSEELEERRPRSRAPPCALPLPRAPSPRTGPCAAPKRHRGGIVRAPMAWPFFLHRQVSSSDRVLNGREMIWLLFNQPNIRSERLRSYFQTWSRVIPF